MHTARTDPHPFCSHIATHPHLYTQAGTHSIAEALASPYAEISFYYKADKTSPYTDISSYCSADAFSFSDGNAPPYTDIRS